MEGGINLSIRHLGCLQVINKVIKKELLQPEAADILVVSIKVDQTTY